MGVLHADAPTLHGRHAVDESVVLAIFGCLEIVDTGCVSLWYADMEPTRSVRQAPVRQYAQLKMVARVQAAQFGERRGYRHKGSGHDDVVFWRIGCGADILRREPKDGIEGKTATEFD